MAGVLSSNRYTKPAGYRTITPPSRYRPFNGFMGGDQRSGPRLITAQSATLTFSAAPADLSTLTIGSTVFTYRWNGSPGAGTIVLVAGGGTAAQAATATQAILAAQLTTWTATLTAANVVTITNTVMGTIVALQQALANITIANTASAIGNVLCAKLGRIFGWLSAGAP